MEERSFRVGVSESSTLLLLLRSSSFCEGEREFCLAFLFFASVRCPVVGCAFSSRD